MGIKAHCLTFGGVGITSSTVKMTMGVINAVAHFERDLLIERTHSGLARAKSKGKTLARPKIFSEMQRQKVIQQLQQEKLLPLLKGTLVQADKPSCVLELLLTFNTT